tara:strand:+ start:287 stop:751 length:465 start_codon:yes stop_codon:yes gene_type:complete
MKFKTILTFITLIIATSSVKAQNEGFAVGAQLFSPAGISVKATISESAAITGAVGFSINEFNNSVSVQTNLILNGDEDTFNVESGLLRFYYGIGLNFLISENTDNGIGIRLPLGIEYTLQEQPLEIYMDIAPTINIEPSSAFFLSSSLGVRYFF